MVKVKQIFSLLFIMFLLAGVFFKVDVLAANMKTQKVYSQNCRGVTDINAESSQKSEFYIYTSWLKYKFNKPYKVYKNKTRINIVCNLSNNNHYYVKIISGKRAITSCTITQHLDKKTVSNKGIKWIAKGNSGVPGGTIIVSKKLYFSRAQVSEALTYVEENKVLDNQTKIFNLTWFVDSTILTGYANSKFVSGYKYNRKTGKGRAKKGIVITVYYYNGIEIIGIQQWNGVDVYGEKGYNGSWSY